MLKKQKWSKISAELKDSNEVEDIKRDASQLQDVLKSKDFTKILTAKKDLDKLKSKIKNLKAKYKNLQKDFNADQKRIQKNATALKDLPKQDISRLKQKYSLDANGGANIVGALINDEVGGHIQTALKYYEILKPYMKSSEETEIEGQVPPRGQGRWIKFANFSNTPSVVIQNAKIGLKLKSDNLEITMKDFSTNQKMYTKPMVIHVDAKSANYKNIIADVIDNRMGDLAKTSFDIKVSEYKVDKLDMQALSMDNISLNATTNGLIKDMNIDATSKVNVTKVQLKMASQKLVNELLSEISSFKIDIALDGDIQKPSIKVASDLDKQLSKGLSSVATKTAKEFEKKLTAGVMSKATGSTSGVSTDIGDISSLLNSKQNSLDGINTSSKSSGGADGLIKKFF
ncbi:hypothetical protein [Candidatus Sulfurimonas baltica]|uniref:hypothetical protein n=1 Tax=Candidatus Sulfurimonas baltica TaxID=2740404 RepID=UPI001E3D1AE3|nr:hypothetical protein [Candidatus Sulfurimonas baltica]